MECRKQENMKNCNCSFSCDKKGVCCRCLTYHRERRELPACFFPDNVEKTGDRSFTKFAELINEGKI